MKKFYNIQQIKKHFKKGITPLLCALTIFNICGINVAASNYGITYPFVEPITGDRSGWLSITGGGLHYLYYYQLSGGVVEDCPIYLTIWNYNDGTSKVEFNISNNEQMPSSGLYVPPSFYLLMYRENNNTWVEKDYAVIQSQSGYHSYSDTFGFPINAFSLKGPFTDVSINVPDMSYDVRFGDLNNIGAIINNFRSDVNSKLNSINSSINTQGSSIDNSINTQGSSINSTINTGNGILSNIFTRLGDLLNQQSEGTVADVSDSQINSVEYKENALVGTNASTSELDVSINPLASSVVWNLVDDVVTRNAKVFTMFVSILTIAVIGLILNR